MKTRVWATVAHVGELFGVLAGELVGELFGEHVSRTDAEIAAAHGELVGELVGKSLAHLSTNSLPANSSEPSSANPLTNPLAHGSSRLVETFMSEWRLSSPQLSITSPL